MIKKFVFAVLCFLPSFSVCAQSPDDPLPESSIKINLPHSNRTKDNLADSLLDYLLAKGFASVENAKIGYSFFELQTGGLLYFKDFSIQLTKSGVEGGLVFKSMTISVKELLRFFSTKTVTFGKVDIQGATADIAVGKQKKRFLFTADEIHMTDTDLLQIGDNDGTPELQTVFSVAAVDVSNAWYANPDKCFGARSVQLKNMEIHNGPSAGITFRSAVADSQTFANFGEMGRVTEKACGKRR